MWLNYKDVFNKHVTSYGMPSYKPSQDTVNVAQYLTWITRRQFDYGTDKEPYLWLHQINPITSHSKRRVTGLLCAIITHTARHTWDYSYFNTKWSTTSWIPHRSGCLCIMIISSTDIITRHMIWQLNLFTSSVWSPRTSGSCAAMFMLRARMPTCVDFVTRKIQINPKCQRERCALVKIGSPEMSRAERR